MNYGFVKVAAAVPHVSVADCRYNIKQTEGLMRKASEEGVQLMAFPELGITAYTCQDLFQKQTLVRNAESALLKLVRDTAGLDIFTVVGLPLVTENRLINAAVAFQKGKILGVVPKTYLPNAKEFQEQRWFTSSFDLHERYVIIGGKKYPAASHMLFTDGAVSVGIELCEDLWAPVPPSCLLAMRGATIIFNLSASNELTGKHVYRRSLVGHQSARCICGYVYAMAGYGESTTDLVFSGGGIIAENGVILNDSGRFSMEEQLIVNEIDVEALQYDRLVDKNFAHGARMFSPDEVQLIPFDLPKTKIRRLTRRVDPSPFVPSGLALSECCEEIVNIQVAALAKRISHVRAGTAVIGISGGLDSTLALMVTALTFDALKIPRQRIIGVTMPGFGTTGRTYNNALELMRSLNISIREISIEKAVLQHFEDIGHDPDIHDITYENSQARERTQILMDIANKECGLLIGTGDISELALGWTTYNGDHMSMYGVNISIPKTLIRSLVEWVAHNKAGEALKHILLDIARTPISPELLPADKDGHIIQKTEDLVGPYELHDFFLYQFMRFGSTPAKIYYLAQQAFEEKYDNETIKKWLHTFFKRFFSQQFKRSCSPDGPKTGSVCLSPRGDWRMPSDASPDMWLEDLSKL